MSVRILVGHLLDRLAELEADSVHLCVTSPPYYSLRAYQTEPQVWGGDPDCAHEWREGITRGQGGGLASAKVQIKGQDNFQIVPDSVHAFCPCGAWRGELGSEPDPGLFVDHLVEVFRAVRRVLHPSGICVVNLGDSMSGSGKGPTGHNGLGDQGQRQGFNGRYTHGNLPPKNLLMVPFRVALALQADGWVLRSVLPWVKRAAMPESVRDRPASSVEYVFLLAKKPNYYWDADAVRQRSQPATIERMRSGWNGNQERDYPGGVQNHLSKYTGTERALTQAENGRNYRNSDPFLASLDAAIGAARAELTHLETIKREGGLLLDEDGEPLSLLVNPKPFPLAHFATFSPGLVLPFVKAGSSERGVCGDCGAPWRRVVERASQSLPVAERKGRVGHNGRPPQQSGWFWTPPETREAGWEPTCRCHGRHETRTVGDDATGYRTETVYVPAIPLDEHPVRPAVCLDPFGGSGTVGLVADRLGRDAVLIELNPTYAEMARRRIASDERLFSPPVEVVGAAVQGDLFGSEARA